MKTKITITLGPSLSAARPGNIAKVKGKPAPAVTPDAELEESAEPEAAGEESEATPEVKGKPALEVPEPVVAEQDPDAEPLDPSKTPQQLALKRLGRARRAWHKARKLKPPLPDADIEALKIEYRSVLREYRLRFPNPDQDAVQ